MFDGASDVQTPTFGFHNCNGHPTHEEHVVRRPVGGWLFCDCQVTPPDWSCAGAIPQHLGICLPTGLTQLDVNDTTRLRLVEIDCFGFVLRQFNDSRAFPPGPAALRATLSRQSYPEAGILLLFLVIWLGVRALGAPAAGKTPVRLAQTAMRLENWRCMCETDLSRP